MTFRAKSIASEQEENAKVTAPGKRAREKRENVDINALG